MSDFASLADGGRRLAPVLAEAVGGLPGVVLLAAIPNGVPVALGAAETLALEVSGLAVERSEAGACVPARPDLAGRHVVVVDDGVETGRVARAAAASLRASGVASRRRAGPVCPREAAADQ
ncbi:MAG: phosphoribosyltransferase, partial [Candidatus Nanopelagicales bacterium]